MSHLTQLRVFWLILFISLHAFAGPVSDAQQKLTQAYNQYYQAISGGKKTPQQMKALREQILTPAMQEVSRAMAAEADQVTKAAEQGQSIGLSSPAPEQPEVGIDGSEVPKELEFPGAPKGAPIPKPTDAGKYTGPYAP